MTAPGADDGLIAALKALGAWCDAGRIPYAVIGGVAVSLQAAPRTTGDVDAVVLVDDTRWAEIIASASAFGISPRVPDVVAFAARTRVLLLKHESGIPIDVSCGMLPFERDLVSQAASVRLGAADLRIAQPIHLLVLKAIANRPQDKADIATLLRAHPTLDVRPARAVVAEFATALEAPELLQDFDLAVARRPG